MKRPGQARDRRWYLAGVILSVAALACAGLATFVRLGHPLAFCFTMTGILAITRPAWSDPRKRARLVALSSGAFLTQVAILYTALSAD